jgi:hypothetical protein
MIFPDFKNMRQSQRYGEVSRKGLTFESSKLKEALSKLSKSFNDKRKEKSIPAKIRE